ncbi:MAG TPA: 3-phosphoglycerate dehydrogenase, partial [Hyphomicrobiaceae bacterium]|nr:3-phosphoglycerate dehydrogenase [Hyphomicrobiaceae bacterium]
MATNKKKVLLTESMSKSGRDLLTERGDIEIKGFPNTIAAAEFQALLSAEAPVNAVALGGTRFGQKEIDA